MASDTLIPPIIIIGATRSGTTMLYRLLSRAPGLCGWHEPNTLWRSGLAYRSTDDADEHDAKPWVRNRTRRLFTRYQRSHGGARVLEKCPYNTVRIRYVHAIFPEARIVNIIRDGRANIRSQVKMYERIKPYAFERAGARRVLMRRLHETPWFEWPAYASRPAIAFLDRLRGRSLRFWGLRYPGWRADLSRGLSRDEIAARQWSHAVEAQLRDVPTLPPEGVLDIRYELLVSEPEAWFRRILVFCGVPASDELLGAIRAEVHDDSVHKWRQSIDPAVLDRVLPIMAPMLHRLGYTDAQGRDVPGASA